MSLKLYFCIVAKGDIPIFESSFGVTLPLESQVRRISFYHWACSVILTVHRLLVIAAPNFPLQKNDLVQFVVHASLDIVEQRAATTTSMFLKSVDKFNDMTISAFVTGAGTSLISWSPFILS
jgi:hypothetical protein